MKFYYNGKKVRESKTHEYKYAIVLEQGDNVKVFACAGTRENALKRLQSEINYQKECAESNLRWGKNPENYKWAVEYYGTYNPEEDYKKHIDKIKQIKIVELEARN